MEDQSASRGSGVYRLGQRPEPNAPHFQRGDSVDQVSQRAAETIKFPNNENVLGADIGGGVLKARPIRFRP
jgi:hypothetical protein